uniref:Uncharacterized protein n=1 Tax=Hemiselmis andersenii TaxID=464988 RepID=A0A7S1GXT7_HEMAN
MYAGFVFGGLKLSTWAFFAVEGVLKVSLSLVLALTVGETRSTLSCSLWGAYFGLLCFFLPYSNAAFTAVACLVAAADTAAVFLAASPVFGWEDPEKAALYAISE